MRKKQCLPNRHLLCKLTPNSAARSPHDASASEANTSPGCAAQHTAAAGEGSTKCKATPCTPRAKTTAQDTSQRADSVHEGITDNAIQGHGQLSCQVCPQRQQSAHRNASHQSQRAERPPSTTLSAHSFTPTPSVTHRLQVPTQRSCPLRAFMRGPAAAPTPKTQRHTLQSPPAPQPRAAHPTSHTAVVLSLPTAQRSRLLLAAAPTTVSPSPPPLSPHAPPPL